MSARDQDRFDPKLDLMLERTVSAPPERVWQAWTKPEQVKRWFTPAPWTTAHCEIDLRPGGVFRFVNRSPEGQEHENICCYLEVIENKRLVWTIALLPGFRPARAQKPMHDEDATVPPFTAVITFEPGTTKAEKDAIVFLIGKVYPVTWKEVNMDEAPITWEKNGMHGYAKLGDKGEVTLDGIKGTDGKQVKIDHLKYWGAQKNDGFYLAYGTHHYKGFGHDYTLEKKNGFFIHIESEGDMEE